MNQEQPYQLASRNWKKENTIVATRYSSFGGDEMGLIAGPCAVESEDQIVEIAAFLKNCGVKMLRGGAYKPRTSPYNFQGLKKEGLELLRQVSREYEMGIVTEVLDLSLLEEVYDYTDILQIGARNMKNYHFLKELGKTDKPILLKRGMDATIEEYLLAAEYILLGGNDRIILCERGIRTFDTSARNTMDVAAIAHLKELSHLPVIADPSQGTGKRSLVGPMSLASIAAGADGLMIEVHNNPNEALSDGDQSLHLNQFKALLPAIQQQAKLSGKKMQLSQAEKTTV
jgi:3-deoxy-7-phosphoheptulonate synthase